MLSKSSLNSILVVNDNGLGLEKTASILILSLVIPKVFPSKKFSYKLILLLLLS